MASKDFVPYSSQPPSHSRELNVSTTIQISALKRHFNAKFTILTVVGLAAAESANPVKALPGAIKQVFWRITLFYILGLFFVGLLVASNDENLLGAENPYAEGASPFVLAARYAGLNGYDHYLNVIILISVLSIGVSCVYGGSRTLTALAQEGYAPKVFTYVDKSGRPLPSVLVILICGALAYVNLDAQGEVVFNWLLSLSALAALFTWGSICLAHIRFRKAWAYHGHTVDEIPFRAVFGVVGSWIGLILCIVVLIAQVCFLLFLAPSFTLLLYYHPIARSKLRYRPVFRCHCPPRKQRRSQRRRGLLPSVPHCSSHPLLLGYRVFVEARGLAPNSSDGRRYWSPRARLGSYQCVPC
tara:strand:- start:36 stop:1106 length:1071 start_codon:yes stop_codon:yes gene_type:complete